MKSKNFVRTLPENYRAAKYINAKDLKFGIIFNLIALGAAVVVFLIAGILVAPALDGFNVISDSADNAEIAIAAGFLIGTLAFLIYVVLHELVHGIVYKILTGERLTFGITWSAAFCGVPHIYVYRKTAVIACAAPLVLFSLLLIPLGILMLVLIYVYSAVWALSAFVAITFVFAFHLGGCSGDIYVILLFLTKFKSPMSLMRDTGPAQSFFIPSEAESAEADKDA